MGGGGYTRLYILWPRSSRALSGLAAGRWRLMKTDRDRESFTGLYGNYKVKPYGRGRGSRAGRPRTQAKAHNSYRYRPQTPEVFVFCRPCSRLFPRPNENRSLTIIFCRTNFTHAHMARARATHTRETKTATAHRPPPLGLGEGSRLTGCSSRDG